jgi:hypothetical protein
MQAVFGWQKVALAHPTPAQTKPRATLHCALTRVVLLRAPDRIMKAVHALCSLWIVSMP